MPNKTFFGHDHSPWETGGYEFIDPEISDADLLSHKSHDLRLSRNGLRCKTCDKDLVGAGNDWYPNIDSTIWGENDANEDISALADPMPIASVLYQLGQNVKDPVMNAIRKKIEGEVDGKDWTHMPQEQRRKALPDRDFDDFIDFNAGKDWTDLHPMIKWKLDTVEADTYKDLTG